MNVNIERSYIYNPERVAEAERLYKEFASRVILREIKKEKENTYIDTQYKEVVV